MTQPPEHLWLVVGRPASADAVKWVADLVAENTRLTAQLAEREAASNIIRGVSQITSADLFLTSVDQLEMLTARRSIGGEP